MKKIAKTCENVTNNKACKEGTTMMNTISNLVSGIKSGVITEEDIVKLVQEKTTQKEQVKPAKKRNRPFKAYSEKNVQIIIRMIKEGKSVSEIEKCLGISSTTIKRYLFMKFEKTNRIGFAKKYWEKLLENGRNVKLQNECNADVRKLDIPCKIDDGQRMSCELQNLKKAISEWFNLKPENLKITVRNLKGPKVFMIGLIHLEVNDEIVFEATENGQYYTGQLEVIAKSVKSNAIQNYFFNQPVKAAS